MHKGYAFVQFTNPFDARNACLGEDGRNILSQTLGKSDGGWVAVTRDEDLWYLSGGRGRIKCTTNSSGNRGNKSTGRTSDPIQGLFLYLTRSLT